jgi:SAM-dependent methyltransferase
MAERITLEELIDLLLEKEELISGTLSAPFEKSSPSKIVVRPVKQKGILLYQFEEHSGEQVFHRNLSKNDCLTRLLEVIPRFKQTCLYSSQADYQILVNRKRLITILKHSPTKEAQSLEHNRKKNYLLKEGEEIPFLIHLGIMTPKGKVIPSKMDKFRQINRFLEIIDDILPQLEKDQVIRIVDFGCGKAYLTFAVYHFLQEVKKLQIVLTGVDLKEQVISDCQKLAKELGYDRNLFFIPGDIGHYHPESNVDLMISLHACDTATDAALEKAVRWKARVILSVPCCQHELYSQVQNDALQPLLKHGILKERFASLATDAARAQLLEIMDYEVQVLEFIDVEHTPKNLLIRAHKRLKPIQSPIPLQCYQAFKEALKISPCLERLLNISLLV